MITCKSCVRPAIQGKQEQMNKNNNKQNQTPFDPFDPFTIIKEENDKAMAPVSILEFVAHMADRKRVKAISHIRYGPKQGSKGVIVGVSTWAPLHFLVVFDEHPGVSFDVSAAFIGFDT